MKKKFYMMCGVPGVGKTTWIDENFGKTLDDCYVLSTDALIEAIAFGYDLTYNDLFGDVSYSFAEKMMHNVANKIFARGDNPIIWDQTNLTVRSRNRKLALVPEDYYKTAVVFNVPSDHARRLAVRAEREGKFIPQDVLDRMLGSFERPTLAEGFDAITEVTME